MNGRHLGAAGIAVLALVFPTTLAGAAPSSEPPGELRSTAEAQRWTPMKATALPLGDAGVKRIALTADGRRAVALQTYSSVSRLVQLNIAKSPARIVGKNASVKGDIDSDLEVRRRHAYVTHDDVLQVVSLKSPKPKIQRRVTIGNNDFWDVALTPNGKYLYATGFNITWPPDRLWVFKVAKNGVPKRIRTIKRFGLGRIEVTSNGKRLVGIDEIHDRVVTYSLKKPGKPKRLGKAFPTGIDDANNLAVARDSRYAYLSGGTTAEVAKVDLRRRRVTKTRRLSTDYGGDIAVTAKGHVVTTLSNAQDEDTGLVFLNKKLKIVEAFKGLCFAQGVAASWAGPTKGRAYVGDSGICTRSAFYPLKP